MAADNISDTIGMGRSKADYSQTLSESGGDYTHGVQAGPPLSQAIGGALSGLADIFSAGLRMRDEDALKSERTSLTNKLNSFVQANAQGKMTRDEMLARSSGEVVASINRVPRFSDELRKTSQETLGLNPSAAQVSDAQQAHEDQRKLQLAAKTAAVDAAVKGGLAKYNDDGSLDVDTSVRNWQVRARFNQFTTDYKDQREADLQALQADHLRGQIAAQGPQSDLLAAQIRHENADTDRIKQGPQLTQSEVSDQEAKTAINGLNEVFNTYSQAGASKLQAIVAQSANLPEAQQIANSHKAYAVWRSQFMTQYVDGFLSHNVLSPKAMADVRAHFDGIMKDYDDIFTGNNSSVSINTQLVTAMTNRNKLDFHQNAQTLAMLNDNGLGTAIAPVVGIAFTGDPGIDNEVRRLTGADRPPTPTEALHATGQAMSGQVPVTKINSPALQTKTLDILLNGVAKTWNTRATPLTPQELPVWGRANQNILDMAMTTADATDLLHATKVISSANSIQNLNKLGKLDEMTANDIGGKMLSVNATNISSNVKYLTATNPPVEYRPPVSSYAQGGARGTERTELKIRYNTETGRVEVSNAGKSGFDPTTGETNQPFDMHGIKVPQDFQDRVNSINRSLDAVDELKDYGTDNLRTMKTEQLKYTIIKETGIPLKGAVPVMPGDKPANKVTVRKQ